MDAAIKKPAGNPSFVKAKTADETICGVKIDVNKRYWFQLTKTYEKLKPTDSKTGQRDDNLYPPYYIAYSEGVAMDGGNMRRWRYIYGYPTIWVDEQQDPEPSEAQLRDQRNGIIFRDGNCFVDGRDRAKLHALLVQDAFEGQRNPINNEPKTFRLVNEDEVIHAAAEVGDKAFEAEKAARGATFAEMLPVAMLFGINVDKADEREDVIRKQFILKARQLPDAFLKAFVNPRNKIKYNVTQGLRDGVITHSNGKVTLATTGKVLFSINPTEDAADQITARIMANDQEATVLYAQLQKAVE